MEETQESETQQFLTASKGQECPRRSPELVATVLTSARLPQESPGSLLSPSSAACLWHTSVHQSQNCWKIGVEVKKMQFHGNEDWIHW